MNKKKIGIYGGSFDPIHIGHINLAQEIMEARHLDEIWFCPSACSPFKSGCFASAEHRLNMIKLAISGQPKWCLTEAEIGRKGPSYTIDTLRQLHAEHKDDSVKKEFFLIIGDDAATGFHRWHQAEEILNYATLLVGRRGIVDPFKEAFEGSKRIVHAIRQGLTHTKVMEISSTDVRNRLQKRLYCEQMIQGKVLDYIVAHHLYL